MMLKYLEYFLPDPCPTSPCPMNEEFPFTPQWSREISLNNNLGDLTKEDLAILVEKNVLHPDSLKHILRDEMPGRLMVYRLAGDRPLWVLPQRSLDHPAILVSDGSSRTDQITLQHPNEWSDVFEIRMGQGVFDAPPFCGHLITKEEDHSKALELALEEGKSRNIPVWSLSREGERINIYRPRSD